MSGANGPDIAAVYQLLTQVARTVTGHDRKLDDLSADVAGLRGTVGGLNAVVAGLSDIVAGHDRKLDDLAAGLASLRDAVTHYHSSVLGHGLLISELDERVRRIERHLKLAPAGG
jgi:ABC-type transporter Mla subunit MlaD